MSKTGRLFDLMQILRRHRYAVSATELAKEAKVSLRTIYRDIAALQAMGADIDGEAGVGYVLKPGFLLPPLMFSDEELQALALGVQWVTRQTDDEFADAAQNVLAKINAVIPSELRHKLNDNAFHVSRRSPKTVVVDLKMLRKAMREQRKLSIVYVDLNGGKTERIIWPIGIGFFESRRILAGWCELRNDFRCFRTDRIERISLQKDCYPGRRDELVRQWRSQVDEKNSVQLSKT